MGRCSVSGCRMKSDKKHPNITLHRLPTCKKRKEQWLDILGIENLNTTTKHIFICSLHFEEKCFNRTLNVTRLRDDALPSSELLLPAQLMSVRNNNLFLTGCWKRNLSAALLTMQIYQPKSNEGEEQKFLSHKALEEEPVCATSSYSDDKAHEIIQKLKSKCEHQKKTIKRLNEKVRRQSKKIADFKTVMKDLILDYCVLTYNLYFCVELECDWDRRFNEPTFDYCENILV